MDEFFQSAMNMNFGPGMFGDLSQHFGVMGYGNSNPHRSQASSVIIRPDPVIIPEEFVHEAKFQPNYDMENDKGVMKPVHRVRSNQHDFDEFEFKLAEGILDAPKLKLTEIPPTIFENTPPIKVIHLKCNEIQELPESFFDELPYLEWLDLRNNLLTSIPPLTEKHDWLRVMLLQDNCIRTLPYSIALAVGLKTIGLRGNPITIPPVDVQNQGCQKILKYMKEKMFKRVPIDEAGDYEKIQMELEEDEKLKEDLKNTAMKDVRNQNSWSTLSEKSFESCNSKTEEKKAAKVIYTWDLWKRIPYEGKSKLDLFSKSLEEIQTQVVKKLNDQQEAILQKIKDKEALKKWRAETKRRQLYDKPDMNVNPAKSAPFGNEMNTERVLTDIPLTPEAYKRELCECLEKIKKFAEFPAPLSDSKQALERLREVESIQQKLMNLKVCAKTAIPM